MHVIFLILVPLLFLIWYVYNQDVQSTDLNLQALAALQSKYVLLSSDKLDSKEFEKQKLEIMKSIGKDIDQVVESISKDIDQVVESISKEIEQGDESTKKELQTTVAVITSLTSDSEKFKKYMTQSTTGLADANVKIVNMAKEIANKVTKSDLDQVRALLESKVSTTDISKLSELIASIESRVSGAMSKEEIEKIIMTKANQAALENVVASVKEITDSIDWVESSKNQITELTNNMLSLSISAKTNADSMESIKTSMASQLKSLQLSMSSLSEGSNKNMATAMSQIATIKAGLENKADVTVVTTAQTNIKTLLEDVSGLKTSIDIINKSLDKDAKLTYIPEEVVKFLPNDNIRFAMNVDAGVVNIGYSSTYTGSKGTSISLEQVRRILGDYEGIMEFGATVWFKSQKTIDSGRPIKFGTSESYIAALLNPASITTPDRSIQGMSFSPPVIGANNAYTATLTKPIDAKQYDWYKFFSKLTLKAIYSVIQLSSKMDCLMEIVIDFSPRQIVSTIKARSSVIQMKAYKDQPGSRYQSRIYTSGLIDASNGITMPNPEYFLIDKFGPVKAGASRAICPQNSYVCGLENIASNQDLYPLCCSFAPGNSSFEI